MRNIKNCFWCNSTDLKPFTTRIDDKPVSECQKCKLLLVTELPDDLSEFYTDDAYFNPEVDGDTGYHENYNLISPLYLYWQGSLINEVSTLNKAKSLLEVGCATGNALEAIHEQNETLQLTGIDLAPLGINYTRAKGFVAEVSTINDYAKKKQKHDIIFTSETMEHVDDLRDFVESAASVLNSDGIYTFYVPAVIKSVMKKEGAHYPSLTTSLEHVSYFTTEFMSAAMKEVFGHAAVIQLSHGGEDYLMGFASKNASYIRKLEQFINALKTFDKAIKDPGSLVNLVIMDAKFSLFDQAQKYLAKLQTVEKAGSQQLLAGAIIAGHLGELERAKKLYQELLVREPAAKPVVYKLIYDNERSLNEAYLAKTEELAQAHQDLGSQYYNVKHELEELKNSKLVGNTLKVRKAVGLVLNTAKNQKKN